MTLLPETDPELEAHIEAVQIETDLEAAWLTVSRAALNGVGMLEKPWDSSGVLALVDGLHKLHRLGGNRDTVPEELVRGVIATMVDSSAIQTAPFYDNLDDEVSTRFDFLRQTHQLDGMRVTHIGLEQLSLARRNGFNRKSVNHL